MTVGLARVRLCVCARQVNHDCVLLMSLETLFFREANQLQTIKLKYSLTVKIFVPNGYANRKSEPQSFAHLERISGEALLFMDLPSVELNTYRINTLPDFFRALEATEK